MRRSIVALSLAGALLVADAAEAAPKPRLKAFSSCKQLVDYARAGALRTDGGTGVVPRAVPMPADVLVTPPVMPTAPRIETGDGRGAGAAPAPTSGGTAIGGTAPDISGLTGTNTQEADVDEPDIVKTDGKRIFAVTDRTLRVVDVASGTVTATLALEGYGQTLMLRGNRVLAIAAKGGGMIAEPVMGRPVGIPVPAVAPTVAPVPSATIITEIDVSGAPKVLRTMEVPGTFVDARQNGGTARLVINADQQPFVPEPGQPVDDQVDEAGLNKFLGHTVLKSNLSGRTFKRNLTPCTAVTHPAQFSGLGVLAILTVDLDRGMYSLDRDGVMAGAQVVYGSAGSLYVASRRYVRALELGQDVPEGLRTEIHRFDVSDPSKTVYRATGTVPGFVLNNYALSEYEGKLRVATTEEPTWLDNAQQTASQSTVTVLDQQDNKLVRVGSVSGLGQGERIYAVRFLGDKGYVVTFRQVDPLYTLDLSDATAPKVVGELKIPGFSSYLHPVGEGKLLGIGYEGSGVQASLFDVTNPAAPQRLAVLGFGSSSTTVGQDSARVPVLGEGEPRGDAAADLRRERSGLPRRRRHPHRREHAHRRRSRPALERRAPMVPVERSFVIGDRLYTLSYLGLRRTR